MGTSGRRRVEDGPRPGDPDERAVEELVEAGADLDRERPVQHYLICADRSGAGTATLQLREAGFDASAFENPTAAGWIVVAERPETVDAASVRLTRSLMELIASRCPGASYDGWHADLLDHERDAAHTGRRNRTARTGF